MNSQEGLKQWEDEAAEVRRSVLPPGVVDKELLRQRSGIDFLNGVLHGELPPPPMVALLDLVPVRFEVGLAVFQGLPGPRYYNPLGTVHGGYEMTLLDTCMACAVHSTLPAGKGYTTLEFKVNFIRAATDKTGPIRAEGKIINAGSQVAVAEGRITDIRGRLYAHATTTCLVFSL